MNRPVHYPRPSRSPLSRGVERAALFLMEPRVSLLALLLVAATAFFAGWRTR